MNSSIYKKWTPELAYAIGLLATDGNLSKDKRHILFTTTDRQLANTFKKCLNINSKIIITPPSGFGKKRAYRINFSNVKLYRWLQKIGLKTSKAHSTGKLKIPHKYFIDFLRGYLDGDGSIFSYIDKYMSYKHKKYTYTRLYTSLISTIPQQIKWIRSRIKKVLNIEGALTSYLKKGRKVHIWQLRFAKNDSLRLLKWLYYKPNLPCLIRKRKIADKFLMRAPHKFTIA